MKKIRLINLDENKEITNVDLNEQLRGRQEILINSEKYIGYFCTDELNWTVGYISKDENKARIACDNSQVCRFLGDKYQCKLRKTASLCDKVKALNECPIDKGIPGGSCRDLWGIYLDQGGDKNISVDDFLSLHLSDFDFSLL